MPLPTRAQLRRAFPTAEELGPGFESANLFDSDEETGSAMEMYVSEPPPRMVVSMGLIGANATTTRELLDASLGWMKATPEPGDSSHEPPRELPPPPFGDDALRVRAVQPAMGELFPTDMIIWRQGRLIASVTVQVPGEPDALPYARRFFDKIGAVFDLAAEDDDDLDPVEPLVVVHTDCPPTHPVKAVREDTGAMRYYRPLDPDYDDIVCDACFATGAAAEAAGYRHVGAR